MKMNIETKINVNDVVLGGQWYKYKSRDGWGVLTLNIVSIGCWVLVTKKDGEMSLVQIAAMPDEPFISEVGDYEGLEVIVSVPGKQIEGEDFEEVCVGTFKDKNAYSTKKTSKLAWDSKAAWVPKSVRPSAFARIFWVFAWLIAIIFIFAVVATL